jgi:hypothetical protein
MGGCFYIWGVGLGGGWDSYGGGLFKMWSLTAQISENKAPRVPSRESGGSGAGGVDGNENDNH